MKLTFKQFEDNCKHLIKNLHVETDWWRDRVCLLSVNEAIEKGETVIKWDEAKDQAKEENKEHSDPRDGIIDINLFLNILENNKA